MNKIITKFIILVIIIYMTDQFIDVSGWYLIAGQKDISFSVTVNNYLKSGYSVNNIIIT